MEPEEKVSGGNMAEVSRAGDTVRREAGFWTPRVQQLLAHLRAKGIREVPAPLGLDAQGREVLTYIPGLVGHAPLPDFLRTDDVLVSAARLLRRIHDATAEVAHGWLTGWQAATRAPVEVICHGDYAPYNCVFEQEKLVGVIDFDHAHPGSRAWDLAYALYRFVPIMDATNPDGFGTVEEQCRRARLFCDAYGLTGRTQLVETLRLRIESMADFLRQGAAKGDPRMLANIEAGHLAIYLTDSIYVVRHAGELEAALAP